jgi:hypothetical protein
MDTDASGTVSLKELLDFLKAVSGDVDAREVMWGLSTNETAPHLGSSTNDILFLKGQSSEIFNPFFDIYG